MSEVAQPVCPRCGGQPLPLQLGGVMVRPWFCGDDACEVLCWDPDVAGGGTAEPMTVAP